jgi:hypothetical protein
LEEEISSRKTLSESNSNETRAYSAWEQVAGYFDGDGSPKAHVNVYTITISVSWADKDIEMIQHVAQFLRHRGVFGNMGKFRTGDGTYYELEVSEGITLS